MRAQRRRSRAIGETKDVAVHLFNDDANFKYNAPSISIVDADPTAEKAWFQMLDDQFVLGTSPTEQEFIDFGVGGAFAMTLQTVSEAGGANPERKFWVRVVVPDGIATANLSGIKVKSDAVEEAV